VKDGFEVRALRHGSYELSEAKVKISSIE
jgi:hypothetical protein